MTSRRVLVVGTTSDYIDIIRQSRPAGVLFITDPHERARAREPSPGDAEEILCGLGDADTVLDRLRGHMNRHGIAPAGIACFDCESLELAARLARALALPFPSLNAVASSRNKYLSKRLWPKAHVPCPRAAIVRSESDACDFLDRLGRPVVLKPLAGAGSQLVHKCSDRGECATAFRTMQAQLGEAGDSRLHRKDQEACRDFDPLRDILAEELIGGQEFSCDFVVEEGSCEIIRTARKIPFVGESDGTTLAYVVPATGGLPPCGDLREHVQRAARALGIERSICMADFIMRDGLPHFLELTPRPGGDCLPWLIRQSSGLDMLDATIDFARGDKFPIPPAESWKLLVGVRIFAREAGVVAAFDASMLDRDPRVLEVYLKHRPGHRVILPPLDYDSRILGHVVFQPSDGRALEEECLEIAAKVRVRMEDT